MCCAAIYVGNQTAQFIEFWLCNGRGEIQIIIQGKDKGQRGPRRKKAFIGFPT